MRNDSDGNLFKEGRVYSAYGEVFLLNRIVGEMGDLTLCNYRTHEPIQHKNITLFLTDKFKYIKFVANNNMAVSHLLDKEW